MHLSTTSNLSRAAILPSDDLNESMAEILFSTAYERLRQDLSAPEK